MNTLLKDIRYGVRGLLKRPGFTAIVVITLALGIGANTAIFSVVNAVLLRPLPYENPDRLVMIAESEKGTRMEGSGPNFLDWKNQSQSFERMAAVESGINFNLTGGEFPERVQGANVSADFFSTLGIAPAAGRAFFPEETQAGTAPLVILSDALWRRRFGGDLRLVGQTITVNGESATVAGVMPPGFQYPADAEMWMPFSVPLNSLSRSLYLLKVVGRLKTGVTLAQAQAEMETIARRLEQQYPATNKGRGAEVAALQEEITGNVKPALLVLLGAVGLVLLAACANIANLLLARALARRREMAVRAALGAGRGRLMVQLLTESSLLAVTGAGAGLLLALWSISFLVNINAEAIPRAREIGLDGRVLLFTLAVSLITGLLFGLAPAWHASNLDLREALQDSGRTSSAGAHRLRSVLVVTEIALALVLLVGAGLLIKSFSQLLKVETGFNPKNVLTMRLELPEKDYADDYRKIAFYEQLLKRVQSLPGVQSAGAVNTLPLSGVFMQGLVIEGAPPPTPSQMPIAALRVATEGYFGALNIPLLSGRVFQESDRSNTPAVAVIDHATAQRFWAGTDALGKRLKLGGPKEPWLTIVGVVGDVRYHGLDRRLFPTVYVPHSQSPFREMMLAVRTSSDPLQSVSAIKGQISSLDRNLPVSKIMPLEQIVNGSLAQRRFNMLLLILFAALALSLAAVGIYGVLSYSVNQRRREIGIRIALGARRADVVRLVVKHGLALALIGVTIGLAGSFALTRLMTSLLFGVTPIDSAIFTIVPLCLIAVALLACFIPARRATKVDPLESLRYE